MKKKTTIKLILRRLILLLAFGVIIMNNSYSQIPVSFSINKSISADCSSCAAVDSIDINGDTITDVYVKIQQWTLNNGAYHNIANALLIWGAASDSVAGGCTGGGFTDDLNEGDTIDSNTGWVDFMHPFYQEPGFPWVCECNCNSEKTAYIAVRFKLRNNAVRYGWLKIQYTKTYFKIEEGAYMNSSNPIIISED